MGVRERFREEFVRFLVLAPRSVFSAKDMILENRLSLILRRRLLYHLPMVFRSFISILEHCLVVAPVGFVPIPFLSMSVSSMGCMLFLKR